MSSRPSRGAARLAAILDALPDALLLVNCNGTVVNANTIALETFEAPGTALVGRGLLDLLPSFDSKRIPGSMRRRDEEMDGPRTKPTRMVARRTDGTELLVEVTSANLEDGRTPYESAFEAAYADHRNGYTGDELLMLVVRDLTGTLDTETELARQQRQTEMILRAAAEGVVGVDDEGKVVLVNPSAAQILGYRASELGGRELHPLIHHSRPDGSPLPWEETPLADTLKSGRKHRVRGQVLWHKDGRSVAVDLTTAPVRDGDQLVGAVMTFTDRRPYDALAARHAQLLAVLDQSLRGPLEELKAELSTLAADPAGQLWPEANQILHHLAAGYTRMTTLVDNVLSFQRLDAGRERLKRTKVSLDDVVAAGVEGAVELIGPGRAQFAVHAPPIEAEVDAERIAQALAHLIADVAGVDATGNAGGGGTGAARNAGRASGTASAAGGAGGTGSGAGARAGTGAGAGAGAGAGDSTIVVAAAKRGDVVRIEVRGPYGGGDPVHHPIVRGIVRQHGGVLQTHEVPGAGGSSYVLEVPVTADGSAATGDRAREATGNETTVMPVPAERARGTDEGRGGGQDAGAGAAGAVGAAGRGGRPVPVPGTGRGPTAGGRGHGGPDESAGGVEGAAPGALGVPGSSGAPGASNSSRTSDASGASGFDGASAAAGAVGRDSAGGVEPANAAGNAGPGASEDMPSGRRRARHSGTPGQRPDEQRPDEDTPRAGVPGTGVPGTNVPGIGVPGIGIPGIGIPGQNTGPHSGGTASSGPRPGATGQAGADGPSGTGSGTGGGRRPLGQVPNARTAPGVHGSAADSYGGVAPRHDQEHDTGAGTGTGTGAGHGGGGRPGMSTEPGPGGAGTVPPSGRRRGQPEAAEDSALSSLPAGLGGESVQGSAVAHPGAPAQPTGRRARRPLADASERAVPGSRQPAHQPLPSPAQPHTPSQVPVQQVWQAGQAKGASPTGSSSDPSTGSSPGSSAGSSSGPSVGGRTAFALPPAAADQTPESLAAALPTVAGQLPAQAAGPQDDGVGTGRRRARRAVAEGPVAGGSGDAAMPGQPAGALNSAQAQGGWGSEPTGRRRARRAAAEERAAAAMADTESTGTFVAGPEGLVAHPAGPVPGPATGPGTTGNATGTGAATGTDTGTDAEAGPGVGGEAGPLARTASEGAMGTVPGEEHGTAPGDLSRAGDPVPAPTGRRRGRPSPVEAPQAAEAAQATQEQATARDPQGPVQGQGQGQSQNQGQAPGHARRQPPPQQPQQAQQPQHGQHAQHGQQAQPQPQPSQPQPPRASAHPQPRPLGHGPGQSAPEPEEEGAGPAASQSHGRAFSVRTLGQGAPFAQHLSDRQHPAAPGGTPVPGAAPAGSGRRRKLAAPPQEDDRTGAADAVPGENRPHPHAAGPRPAPHAPAPGAPLPPDQQAQPQAQPQPQPQPQAHPQPHPNAPSHLLDPSEGRAFAISAPDDGSEGPEPLDGPNGAVEVVDHQPPPMDDELPPEPLDNPRRLLVWPAPDASTEQALTDRGYRPVIVNSREEVDAQIAAYPAALFIDPLTGPITRTALQSLRQAAVAAEVPVLVTAGLGQATREAAYGADPAVLLKALAPRDSEMHPARVLLAEENDAIAGALTASLERRGMQVARAATDADAVTLAAQMRPNLLVMDLMQVRRRRAGIVDWLRANGLLAHTPLVVYTSADLDPAQLPQLAAGETVLFLAERSTSAEVQTRIVDLLAKIGTN
ncbi:PAS domain-containing protein [Streptomyces sp. MST-110588]|uniref:PAS domain-containing protein n=1 Tax=Streptomyces sp. MST-110588 TaxID=2833628 RepID=UPI001F5DE216|nr:PAS domain-containing protein [Streptomyces sp. MST-110588]UNO40852.1 PAS domain-containing protein [Streptomyces sp. MST-110588]